MVKFFADEDNVIVSLVGSSCCESFMQVLKGLFHDFVVKNGLCLRETKPLGKLCCLAFYLKEQH